MMNVFEKIREKIEEKAFSVQIEQGIKEPSTFDAMMEKFSVLEIKEVIKQVEQEHNNEPIKTNADYIRNMTDEELGNLLEDIRTHGFTDLCCNDCLCDSDGCDCCIIEWLQEEREG